MTKTQTFEWEAVLAEATMNQAELTPLVPDDADDPARDAHSANAARLLYSGEQFDPAIGLQFLRARAYSATTSRFSSLDHYISIPTAPQSLDKYRYAHDCPIEREWQRGERSTTRRSPHRPSSLSDLPSRTACRICSIRSPDLIC